MPRPLRQSSYLALNVILLSLMSNRYPLLALGDMQIIFSEDSLVVRYDSACWPQHNHLWVTSGEQRILLASDPLNDNDIEQVYPWYHDLVLFDLQLLSSTQAPRLNFIATIHNCDGARGNR